MPILDTAIVAATLVTALYCAALNRRLKRMHDLKGGLGGAVAGLAGAVTRMKEESEAVTARMNAAADRVEALLVQVDASEPKVTALLETMDQQARQVWREDRLRAAKARDEMKSIERDAATLASLLNDQITAIAEGQAADAQPARRAPQAPVRKDNVVRVAPAAQRAANPFARAG